MTWVSDYKRGYRAALRDVYRALCILKTREYRLFMGLGLGEALNDYSCLLSDLKVTGSPLLQAIGHGERNMGWHLNGGYEDASLGKRERFAFGYRDGFDKAIETLMRSARRMRHPPARQTLSDLINRLERVRLEVHQDQQLGIRVLKKRGYRF